MKKDERCARARAEAVQRAGHSLKGDVDGDGVPDQVSVVRLNAGNARCGAVLVVRTRGATLTRSFATVGDPRVPSLNGLAALGPGRGLRIVVTTWEGASTAFARVFAVVRSGRLTSVTLPGSDGSFPYEGSVTHLNAVDCSRGLVVASGWFVRGRNFGFERRFYRIRDGRFELVRRQDGTLRSPFPPLNRFGEFSQPQPFPSCMRVRAE